MRLTFEPDIPEFKNKSREERRALYQQAGVRDKRIGFRSILANLTFVPVFSILMELRKHDYLPSLLWVFALYLAIGIPLVLLVRALCVNPLIKAAVQSIHVEGRAEHSVR